MKTAADFVVEFFARHGVQRAYGYLGGPITPLVTAFESRKKSEVRGSAPPIDFVVVRNECNAAFAASAEAKLTGHCSLCVVTAGPGLVNAVAGLADAHTDHAPVVCISGDLPSRRRGFSREFQFTDQAKVVQAVTLSSVSVSHPEALPSVLLEAFVKASTFHDVVHISVPRDFWSYDISSSSVFEKALQLKSWENPMQLVHPDDNLLDKVAEILKASLQHNLVIAVGLRARGSGKYIAQLAENLQAPVLYELDGKGVVSDSHPNVIGVLGIFGLPASEISLSVINKASYVLSIGVSNLSPFTMSSDGNQIRKVIGICCCSSTLIPFTTESAVVGNISESVNSLLNRFPAKVESPKQMEFLTEAQRMKVSFMKEYRAMSKHFSDHYAHPIKFLIALHKQLKKRTNSRLCLDIGDNTIWAAHFLRFTGEERLINSVHMGAMGWSIPSSIACKMTEPNSTVIGLTGDGGAQMTLEELGTAIQYHLPILFIIFDNSKLQHMRDSPYVGITNPDFAAVGRAYGAMGLRIGQKCSQCTSVTAEPCPTPSATEPEAEPSSKPKPSSKCCYGVDKEGITSALQDALAYVDSGAGPAILSVTLDPALDAPMASVWS
ncbi:thiamine pyrophosphate-binding protein [Pelomyxa schiedti]|nr:thiamine pyrophosphate-binding protein [Pelomyxa schiedti]